MTDLAAFAFNLLNNCNRVYARNIGATAPERKPMPYPMADVPQEIVRKNVYTVAGKDFPTKKEADKYRAEITARETIRTIVGETAERVFSNLADIHAALHVLDPHKRVRKEAA